MTSVSISSDKHKAWLLLAANLSILVAVTLIVIKAGAWYKTGSASLLGSLIDSAMDSAASLINMLAIRWSLKPADEDHRFGHGKAEFVAAVAQSAFILGSAAFLLFYCVERLLGQGAHQVQEDALGMAVMVVSIVLTALLLLVQRIAIKKTGSGAIEADYLHYVSDVAVNASVIFALFMARIGYQSIDLVLGVLIAAYIAYTAFGIGSRGLQLLMDKELPSEVVEEIISISLGHPEVEGIHDVRTRQSGNTYIIQLHLEMKDDMPLRQAHRVSDQVERRIKKSFPNSDVLIHQDPVGIVESGARHFSDRIARTGAS